MIKRPPLLCLIILLMAGMVGELSADENNDDALAVTDESLLVEQENVPEVLPKRTVRPVTTKDKRRSIKMIVGGQSEGGLAKQVTLPVSD